MSLQMAEPCYPFNLTRQMYEIQLIIQNDFGFLLLPNKKILHNAFAKYYVTCVLPRNRDEMPCTAKQKTLSSYCIAGTKKGLCFAANIIFASSKIMFAAHAWSPV